MAVFLCHKVKTEVPFIVRLALCFQDCSIIAYLSGTSLFKLFYQVPEIILDWTPTLPHQNTWITEK